MHWASLILYASSVVALYPYTNGFMDKAIVPVSELRLPPADWISFLDAENHPATAVHKAVSADASSPAVSTIDWCDGLQLIHSDNNQISFYVSISLFEPTLPISSFRLILDTGSAYTWVYGSECTLETCDSRLLYQATTLTNTTFQLAYGTGTAKGNTSLTSMVINNVLLTNDSIGVATEVPPLFDGYNVSGVLGLPANDDNGPRLQNVVTALHVQDPRFANLFTISLGTTVLSATASNGTAANATVTNEDASEADKSSSIDGLFAMGVILDELYTGEISYTPVEQNTYAYWMVTLDALFVESFPIVFNATTQATSRKVIFDSGTTLLVLPTKDAVTLHSYFPGSFTDGTNYAILCNTTTSLNFAIGSANWTLTPADYLGESYPELSSYFGYCVSNIQGVDGAVRAQPIGGKEDGSLQAWLLGSIFLKKVFAVFDLDNQRMGLAQPVSSVRIARLVPLTTTAINTQTEVATTNVLTQYLKPLSTSLLHSNGTLFTLSTLSTLSSSEGRDTSRGGQLSATWARVAGGLLACTLLASVL